MSIDPDGLSPAERELVALLELLRTERLEPSDALADAVLRTVEWQVLVRSTIILLGDLVGSMAAVLTMFLSSPSRTPEDRE
jgi:hypothetical protein